MAAVAIPAILHLLFLDLVVSYQDSRTLQASCGEDSLPCESGAFCEEGGCEGCPVGPSLCGDLLLSPEGFLSCGNYCSVVESTCTAESGCEPGEFCADGGCEGCSSCNSAFLSEELYDSCANACSVVNPNPAPSPTVTTQTCTAMSGCEPGTFCLGGVGCEGCPEGLPPCNEYSLLSDEDYSSCLDSCSDAILQNPTLNPTPSPTVATQTCTAMSGCELGTFCEEGACKGCPEGPSPCNPTSLSEEDYSSCLDSCSVAISQNPNPMPNPSPTGITSPGDILCEEGAFCNDGACQLCPSPVYCDDPGVSMSVEGLNNCKFHCNTWTNGNGGIIAQARESCGNFGTNPNPNDPPVSVTPGTDCNLPTGAGTDSSLDHVQAWFRVEGTLLHMTDTIDGTTPGRFEQAKRCHPEAKEIVMGSVPGSADDVANVQVAKSVRENGYTTKLLATSYVASGGTDFFLAGVTRTVESGACIGVHSWAGGEITVPAADLPRDSLEHKKYTDLYTYFGMNTEFYWFTLAAAPASGMYYMNQTELEEWNVGTNYPPSSNPAQPISCSARVGR